MSRAGVIMNGGARPRRPEQEIHRAVVQHLRTRAAPGLVWTHVPNGGSRRPVEAAIFKSLGLRAGVSDLLFWHQSRAFALELKAPDGRSSPAQMEFISDFNAAGGTACITVGLDETLRILEIWGLLRGRVTS